LTHKADVVFTFSYEMFEDSVAREFCTPADQTLLALATDDRIGNLVVSDPFRSYVLSAARRRPTNLIEPFEVGGRTAMRARPHRLRRHDATDVATVEKAYQKFGELLGDALAQTRGEPTARPDSATLVTYHPFAAAWCDAPWISRIIYFGQDDWATGEGVRRWWDVYKAAYRRMEERKVDIFAVSQELCNRISPRAEVVPNGVIADKWRPLRPAPARIAELPGPRVIYTGSIGPRLDKELVEITAKMAGSLIFMGHFGDAGVISWLRTLPNVHVFDRVGQEELAATTQACDVGVIPHRDQAGIAAMSPLKLYEYLSAGLPAVVIDLPPMHGVDDERVQICSRDQWAQGLQRALSMGRADEPRRQRFIDEVSWQTRMAPVVDAAVR
jgi:teichuronic acid biosynthesis glycosyltransferase TuaH